MKNLNELLQHIKNNNFYKPPLLIGKGPSFNLKDKILLNNYFTIALNHAVEKTKCDAVSIIDIDVIRDCPEAVYKNSKSLIMPWHPHDKNNNFKPCTKTLLDYCKEIKVLELMVEEGRIYSYNASSAEVYSLDCNSNLPNYNVYINNGDSIFGILATNNFENIYSIGIDGGESYSNIFYKYSPCGNGRSFSESLNMINKISNVTKSKLIKLK